MIILKEQKFDYLFGFSRAMALSQQSVARTIKSQMLLAEDSPKSEFSILIGCLEGVLRESIQQIAYMKAEKKAKSVLDFKLMKNDLNKLLYVFDKAHSQIEDIIEKSDIIKN
jgi:hypothetical protein